MKIALLSFEYPPGTGFGGIGTYTWYHARALVKLGHEVHVLAGAKAPTHLQMQEHDGVAVYRFRATGRLMRGFHLLNICRLSWTKNRLENALSMYQGLTLLRREHEFDIAEMPECGAEGLLINHLTRMPTLVRFHSPAELIMSCYDVRPADITFCSRLERLSFRNASAYTSCSQFLSQELRNKLKFRRPIRVIPNGIDLELFDAGEEVDIRRNFGIRRDQQIIFFCGRMERRKGIHLCKEIAATILERYDVAFVFAGQDLFNYMSQILLPYLKTKKLRGSVHYLGKLDLIQVRSCLKQSDIFLLPSLWENCPYSCLEAMAARRAIVSSDQGGMPELIRDGENGLLATSENVASYIRALEQLIENRALRDRLGAGARESVEKSYTDVHVARLSVEHYREYLSDKDLGGSEFVDRQHGKIQ
jgi:glycogen synthase